MQAPHLRKNRRRQDPRTFLRVSLAFQDYLDGFDKFVYQRSNKSRLLAGFVRCDFDEFEEQAEDCELWEAQSLSNTVLGA